MKLTEREKREWRNDILSLPIEVALKELREDNEDDEKMSLVRQENSWNLTERELIRVSLIQDFVNDRMAFRTSLIQELEGLN